MLFLLPNQQRGSHEGSLKNYALLKCTIHIGSDDLEWSSTRETRGKVFDNGEGYAASAVRLVMWSSVWALRDNSKGCGRLWMQFSGSMSCGQVEMNRFWYTVWLRGTKFGTIIEDFYGSTRLLGVGGLRLLCLVR